MGKNNIFKQAIRFIFVQIFITFLTIYFFDNYLIGAYTDGFVIILENLIEDKNRFYPFINTEFVKIDMYLAIYVLIFMVLLHSSNFYNYSNDFQIKESKSYFDEYFNIFLLWTSTFMIFLVLFRFTILSRGFLILFNLIVPLVLLLFRNTEYLSSLLGKSAFSENFISFNLDADSVIRKLRILTLRNEIQAINNSENNNFKFLKSVIDKCLLSENFNLVVYKIPKNQILNIDVEEYLLSLNKKILFISEDPVKFKKNYFINAVHFENRYLYYINNDIQYGRRYLLKRFLDIFLSFALILVTLPFAFLTMIFILFADGFPPLIKQERIGLHGKSFKMYKFRTMKLNSHNERENLKDLNQRSGPLFKIENDPRLIKGSKLIRKFSIDEIPQLLNVLKGEMSLVGPRPLFAEDNQYFDEIYIRRLNVLPGITGLLQINERNTSDFEIWHKYDTTYIENWSIYNDLKILLKTPIAIFKNRNSGF